MLTVESWGRREEMGAVVGERDFGVVALKVSVFIGNIDL